MARSLTKTEERQLNNLKDKRWAASYLDVSVKTLDRWIYERRGPQYVKVGSLVRYRPEDLTAFVESCLRPGGAAGCVKMPHVG